jgi:hemerythrin superfamily protein
VSTTISPESYAFLRGLIRSGKAENLAQALDLVLDEIRRADNRERLERATAAYYDNLTAEEIQEENELGGIVSASSEITADE